MDERHAFYANIFRHVTKYIFIYSLLIEIVGVYIIAIVNLANPMYQPRLIGINFTIFRTLGSFCFGTLCFISILYKLNIRNVDESSNSDWCVFLYLISEIVISIIVTTFLIDNPDYDKKGILVATVCNFYSFVGIKIIFGNVSYFHAP